MAIFLLITSCFAGIASLGAQFAKLRKGLKHLNFSKTSLSPKGTSRNLLHYLKVFPKCLDLLQINLCQCDCFPLLQKIILSCSVLKSASKNYFHSNSKYGTFDMFITLYSDIYIHILIFIWIP